MPELFNVVPPAEAYGTFLRHFSAVIVPELVQTT
jgi:hypothetical protein